MLARARPAPSTARRPPVQAVVVVAVAVVVGTLTARYAVTRSRSSLLLLAAAIVPLVLAALDARRVLLGAVIVETAFQMAKSFHYRSDAAGIGALGGLEISITTFAVVGLYVIWLGELLARTETTPTVALRRAAPVVCYVVLSIASIAVAREHDLATYEAVMLVQTLLLFVYVAARVRTTADVLFVVQVLVATLALEGLVVVAERFVHVPYGYVSAPGPGQTGGLRYGGTIGSPNTAASFFALSVPVAVAVLFTPVSSAWRWVAALGATAGTVALALTGSRGGVFSLAISLAVLLWAAVRRRWVSAARVWAFVGVLVLVLVPIGSVVLGRTFHDQGAARDRLPLIGLAWHVIRAHPLLGVGLNNLGPAFQALAGPRLLGTWIYTVHDKYLLVWAEAGALALGAYLWFLGAVIVRGVRASRLPHPVLGPVAVALTAGVAGQLAHMAVDIFQSRPQVQMLWIVAAMLTALAEIERRARGRPRGRAREQAAA